MHQPLDEFLRSLDGNVEQTSETLRQLVTALRTIDPDAVTAPGKSDSPFRACKRFYRGLTSLEKRLMTAKRIVMEMETNAYWLARLPRKENHKSYEQKKEFAKELNADMREYGFAIRHPDSGDPCHVLAIATTDGFGRYVLANQFTKKRSHASQSLIELFPVRLVPAPRRREGFLEKDKRGDVEE